MENNLDNNTVKKTQKNSTLLFFEAVACVLIVFIHCEFPGDFGIFMNGFARFGVPLFFVVSGFFMISSGMELSELRQKLKKRMKRLIILLLFSFSVYLILDVIKSCCYLSNFSFITWLINFTSLKRIVLLLVCNNPLTNLNNWFMVAMLFSYCIIYFFPKLFMNNKFAPFLIASSLIFWIVFRLINLNSGLSLFGVRLANEYIYRSWYANGLPFICLGIILKRYENVIIKIPSIVVISFLIFFSIAGAVEHFLVFKWLGSGISYYFCNIFTVIFIIIICIKKEDFLSNNKFLNQEGNWTMFVYIFHPIVISTAEFFLNFIGLNENIILLWINPIIVIVFTIIFAKICNLILIKTKKFILKR